MLPVIFLFLLFAGNKTTDNKNVNALMVSIAGEPGLEIGKGSSIKTIKTYQMSSQNNVEKGLAGDGGGTGINSQTSYAGEIIKKINEYKYYPQQARLLKLTGNVELAFSITEKGNLNAGIIVITSSGHTVLDQTAVKIVKNAAPFPHFPENIKEKVLNLKVNIDFNNQVK